MLYQITIRTCRSSGCVVAGWSRVGRGSAALVDDPVEVIIPLGVQPGAGAVLEVASRCRRNAGLRRATTRHDTVQRGTISYHLHIDTH